MIKQKPRNKSESASAYVFWVRWEARALDVYRNQACISLPEDSTDVSHSKWHVALRTLMLWLHKIHDSCVWSGFSCWLIGCWAYRGEPWAVTEQESIAGVHWEVRPAVHLQLYWGRLRSPWENCIRPKAAVIRSTSRHQRNTITSATSAVFQTSQTQVETVIWLYEKHPFGLTEDRNKNHILYNVQNSCDVAMTF